MVRNNCIRYEHADGYPMPESRYSCRGCKNSFDPNLYDAGCRHPDGPQPRESKAYKRLVNDHEENRREPQTETD